MSVNATYILCSPTCYDSLGMPGWSKTNCPHCGREIWVTPDDMDRIREERAYWGCSECMVRMAGRPAKPRRRR